MQRRTRGLSVFVLAAACSMPLACGEPPAAEGPRLVATASQMGPVGYRDPAGGVSPDGRWIAYTEGRNVIVEPLGGGDRVVLGPAPSQVRYVTWIPDSRHLAVHERSFDRRAQWWTVYDVTVGEGSPLWGDAEPASDGRPGPSSLLELSWDPSGETVVGVVRDASASRVWQFDADGENGVVIAESKDTVVVEGNHYFPPGSINNEFFKKTGTHTNCPWKGEASYYTIEVDGQRNDNAAWYYEDPSEAARQIKDRVAFWKGVQVTD